MKYFKHWSNDRNHIHAKVIRAQFGAKGYGWFTTIKELVAENVESDNLQEWGHIHHLHTKESIAQECDTTVDELMQFIKFCDDRNIFEKSEKGLYYPEIWKILDEYAARIKAKKRRGRKVGTKSGQSTDIVGQMSVKSSLYKEEELEEDIKKENKEKKESLKSPVTPETPQDELQFLKGFLSHWNVTFGTRYTSTDALSPNFRYWLTQYSLDDLKKAATTAQKHHYWWDKISPEIFLRRMNPNKERVDHIAEMLNYKPIQHVKSSPARIEDGYKVYMPKT